MNLATFGRWVKILYFVMYYVHPAFPTTMGAAIVPAKRQVQCASHLLQSATRYSYSYSSRNTKKKINIYLKYMV